MQTSIQIPPVAIAMAVDLLAGGNVVAFPTETVYGLGADAGRADAVERVYRVKGRPANNPLIVHAADVAAAQHCAGGWNPAAEILAKAFWPGPLTMVLPRGPRICVAACAGLDTMAIRVPNHPVAQEILARFGRPVCAPSANVSGHTSPTSAAHVLAELDGRILLIVDGGNCTIGLESTVVDMTADAPRVLRPGAITQEMIQRQIAAAGLNLTVHTAAPACSTADSPDETGAMVSPGLFSRHYAPRTPAFRFSRTRTPDVINWLKTTAAGRRVIAVAFPELPPLPGVGDVLVLPAGGADCARQLYATLRRADESGGDLILLEMPELRSGVWAAIVDRISRAAQEMP